MNKTDLEEIAKIVNTTLDNKMDEFEGRMTGRMDEFEEKMTGRMDEFEERMICRMDEFEGRMTGRMDEFEEKMTDKMFTFEQEYGTKIDAIYEIALMQKEKAQEVYDKQEKSIKKVEQLELKVYDIDRRVFKLEHNSN